MKFLSLLLVVSSSVAFAHEGCCGKNKAACPTEVACTPETPAKIKKAIIPGVDEDATEIVAANVAVEAAPATETTAA